MMGISGGPVVKNPHANTGDARDSSSIPNREDPWRRKWQPTPVFWPRKFHGQMRLVGCSPWDHRELDIAEHMYVYTHTHTHTHTHKYKKINPALG